jgi:DNA-directed RNA polymerase specialized sigma24 family protein
MRRLAALGVERMSDPLPQKKWNLTQEAFDRFLACLDQDREVAGALYLKIRSKLITYFQCRDCPFPEDYADETINRVVRKIETEGIRDPATYVYGVARMLLLEIAKQRSRHDAALEHLSRSEPAPEEPDDHDLRVECFRQCLQSLSPENREMITQYYEGERRVKIENRSRLAERLSISGAALRIRACRIRDSLEKCIARCSGRNKKG